MFLTQVLLYTILIFNWRSVAQGQIMWAASTDAVIATINFFIIRKIIDTKNLQASFTGYLAGSVVGTIIGIVISKYLLGF